MGQFWEGVTAAAPTFLSFHVGVGEEPGARRGEDGGHAELSSAGFARGDLRRRLRLASVGREETSREINTGACLNK